MSKENKVISRASGGTQDLVNRYIEGSNPKHRKTLEKLFRGLSEEERLARLASLQMADSELQMTVGDKMPAESAPVDVSRYIHHGLPSDEDGNLNMRGVYTPKTNKEHLIDTYRSSKTGRKYNFATPPDTVATFGNSAIPSTIAHEFMHRRGGGHGTIYPSLLMTAQNDSEALDAIAGIANREWYSAKDKDKDRARLAERVEMDANRALRAKDEDKRNDLMMKAFGGFREMNKGKSELPAGFNPWASAYRTTGAYSPYFKSHLELLLNEGSIDALKSMPHKLGGNLDGSTLVKFGTPEAEGRYGDLPDEKTLFEAIFGMESKRDRATSKAARRLKSKYNSKKE